MPPLPLPPLILLLLLLLSHSPLLSTSASSSIPLPTLPSSSATPATAPTIPAFPEQSAITSSSSCPSLSFPSDLLPSLSSPSPSCPSIAAALYSAFAPAALSLPPVSSPLSLPDLPSLPDDSESCAGQLEKELKAKGVRLPRVNDTCDVAYCYCGVRLRRLSCSGDGFVADEAAGRWTATKVTGRRLERECRRPGVAGCSRCLKTLNQLSTNVSRSSTKQRDEDARECQLMGLTWLLSKNRTLYLPTATSVLRALMAVPDGKAGPTSCTVPHDEMPFAVGSDEISGVKLSTVSLSSVFVSIFVLIIMLPMVIL